FSSLVENNTIVDATDGGIVVFGAPGSTVRNNTIRAATRSLLGGINMVDYSPTSGDYTGTIVENNTVDASGALIRVGIAMGPRVWFDCSITQVNRGGTVRNNTLTGSHMRYGYAADGVTNWTVLDNVSNAVHSGVGCSVCDADPPGAFQRHIIHSGGTFQPEFVRAQLHFAICVP